MKKIKTTLVILAAGIGSRYGVGLKQLAQVGPHGEILMEYSIYDAQNAGFDKVVFIIKKDIEQEFKAVVGDHIAKHIEVEYVYQEICDVPEEFQELAKERKSPWGTGQAVLCCKDVVKEPFVVINADDYYGKEAFVKLHDFLVSEPQDDTKTSMAMAGFSLERTLSASGTVTRGICIVEGDQLTRVIETYGIREQDGKIVCDDPKVEKWICRGERVSMNMWAAPAFFIDKLETGFGEFLKGLDGEAGKREYLLPTIVDQMIHEGTAGVKVLETEDQWFGITYQEDKEPVQKAFAELIEKGTYPAKLWEE